MLLLFGFMEEVFLKDSFGSSHQQYLGLTKRLSSSETMWMKHSDLENLITTDGRELLRRLFEEHIQLCGYADVGKSIVGSDGIERTHKRLRRRVLISIFGPVTIERMGYSHRKENSLFPKDALLNLPDDSYSYGMRKLVAIDATKTSFSEVIDSVKRITGISISKRQAELLTCKAAHDFDEYYAQKMTTESEKIAKKLPLVILTTDCKGIVMRHEDLRDATKKKAESREHKLKKRMSPGEKSNAKRMATVASVYQINRFMRTPEEIMGELSLTDITRKERPRPIAKRVWASIEKNQADVIFDIFNEASRRDKKQQKEWVCLIDGDRKQLKKIRTHAKKMHYKLTIIMDIIHVIEYVWSAARAFYDETNSKTEAWVAKRLLEILRGRAGYVAGGIRRSATLLKIETNKRKPIEKCAHYLINNAPYLRYNEYLTKGYPIATGIIEGACRHLIKDRMDITGARWSLIGAESVVKLRSLRASGDFDEYWVFHESQEYIRNHRVYYENPKIIEKMKNSQSQNTAKIGFF